MQDSDGPDDKRVAASGADEFGVEREDQGRENEGGHMSSTSGRVIHRAGADLPYVVVLQHQGSEATEHAFATMREAEAFIKRNTPLPGGALSPLYDRPASDS